MMSMHTALVQGARSTAALSTSHLLRLAASTGASHTGATAMMRMAPMILLHARARLASSMPTALARVAGAPRGNLQRSSVNSFSSAAAKGDTGWRATSVVTRHCSSTAAFASSSQYQQHPQHQPRHRIPQPQPQPQPQLLCEARRTLLCTGTDKTGVNTDSFHWHKQQPQHKYHIQQHHQHPQATSSSSIASALLSAHSAPGAVGRVVPWDALYSRRGASGVTPWVHAARAQYLTGRRAFSSLQPHDSSTATQTSTTPPPTGVPGDSKAADLQSKVLAQSGGKGKKVKGSSKSSSKKGSKKAKNRGASKGWRHAPTSSPHAPSTITRVTDAAKRGGKAVVEFIPKLAKMPFTVANAIGRGIKLTFTDPREALAAVGRGWGKVKEAVHHYVLGTKLLYQDTKTAAKLLGRMVSGHQLTRRERKQLTRTAADLFRLVPMAIFVVVPFMEFLLPVALKVFPNLLPSTFQSQTEKADNMKKVLRARLRMASFLQDTVKTMATEIASREAQGSAHELMQFVEAMRAGDEVPTEAIVQVARLFGDEITLDNAPRAQLVAMAKYMGIPPYGADSFLRFQLRNHIRIIKDDDKQIIWEGIDTLSKEELIAACEERGMRADGLSTWRLRRQLQQWLDLSVDKNVPTSLLILSRALTITATVPEEALKASISAIDEDVLNEAVLERAAATGEDDDKLRSMKLASVQRQQAMIATEAEEVSGGKVAQEHLEPAEEDAPERMLDDATAEAAAAVDAEAEAIAAATSAGVAQGAATAAPTTADVAAMETPTAEAWVVDPVVADAMEHDATHAATELLGEDEAELLASIVKQSAVETERHVLSKVKASSKLLDVASMLARGRIGLEAQESRSTDVVRGYLDSYLDSLETQLDNVEKQIDTARAKSKGDTDAEDETPTENLDRDRDGMVTAEELRAALVVAMKKEATHAGQEHAEESAAAIVDALDEDRDGLIPLVFLQQLAREYQDKAAAAKPDSDETSGSQS